MLDDNFGILQEQKRADLNTYTLGRGFYHIVIACLVDAQYRTTSTATVANNMIQIFSGSLCIGFIVGGAELLLMLNITSAWNRVSRVGSVVQSQGKYEEAEAMHQRARAGREKALDAEHPHTLTSVSQLGSVLEGQGKYKEAAVMH